jgi:hypothetical protein
MVNPHRFDIPSATAHVSVFCEIGTLFTTILIGTSVCTERSDRFEYAEDVMPCGPFVLPVTKVGRKSRVRLEKLNLPR